MLINIAESVQLLCLFQLGFFLLMCIAKRINLTHLILLTVVLTALVVDALNVNGDLTVSIYFLLLSGAAIYLFFQELFRAGSVKYHTIAMHLFPPLLISIVVEDIIFLYALFVCSQLVYFWCVLNEMIRHVSSFSEAFSRMKTDSPLSIYVFLVSYLVIAIEALCVVSYLSGKEDWCQVLQLAKHSLLLITACCFCLNAVRTGDITLSFLDKLKINADKIDDSDFLEEIFREIDKIVIEEELYRTPRISLSALSDKCGFNVREISRAINVFNKTSFNDYINKLRIEFVSRELDKGAYNKSKVLELGFQAGFSSKTSFNTVFKKFNGCCPTRYVDRNKLVHAQLN